MVPVHRAVSRCRGTSQNRLLLSWFDQVFGGLVDPRIHQACWGGDRRKLREEHREASCCSPHCQASISGRQRHLRSSHTVSRTHLLPEGRESHSRGAWSPWQHQEPKTTAGRRWDSWGEWSIGAFAYVTALCLCRLFPDPLDPLAGSMVDSSMPFPVLHSPSAKGGCEVSTVPMSPYAHHMPFSSLPVPA